MNNKNVNKKQGFRKKRNKIRDNVIKSQQMNCQSMYMNM